MRVSFFKCECGLQLKVVQMDDNLKSNYVCECRKKTLMNGSVVMMFGANNNSGIDVIWLPIPKKQIVPD